MDELLSHGEKNAKTVTCQQCGSIVLKPNNATLVKKEKFLPSMRKKTEGTDPAGDTLQEFWLVTDMYTFENVGFTNTVENIKFLICADCEIGPIGWHDLSDKQAFYIALERVEHK
ncbi:RABIF [Branchiostoma lanceolatum]|uniref:Guanine nucleotide exchange factor MSS4 n=1 Tax=Branchiostoma lanceolatum TaxID=7740 RepID=A0A8K0A4R6_BRALA|nr:RABIF [Branchiostoma lanceolatum]